MMERQKKKQTQKLSNYLAEIRKNCTSCGLCRKECGFLQTHGLPGEIAEKYNPANNFKLAFECSLCSLCTKVCPISLDPCALFLEMRRDAFTSWGEFREHRAIRNYERIGVSSLFSSYNLPSDCRSVFFPGCALPGTRPERVVQVYDHLKKDSPDLGIVLDCCTKPSHDLGNQEFFGERFAELKSGLLAKGVREVVVACPNCYKVFSSYGGELEVTTVYEKLLDSKINLKGNLEGIITLHDPCAVRFQDRIHMAARELISRTGLRVEEMQHNRQHTICCGEGGAAGLMVARRAADWSEKRLTEAGKRSLATYCAGCANLLSKNNQTFHLLDLLFAPERTMAGKYQAARSPFTYLNRLKLKRYFRKKNP